MAFLYLVFSIITGQSIHAINPADIVDGGQDKQLDAITIEQSAEEATIYIIQAKNTDSFSSNNLIQMRNGLLWFFDKPRADINTLANIKLKDKLFDFRNVQNELGPSNINIVVAYVTNGLTSQLRSSDEFRQEEKTIRDAYDNGTFAKYDLYIWGAEELVDQLNMLERQGKKIDADIRIQYDRNNPSLIKFYADKFTGMVCTSPAHEIARIVNSDPTGSIFDSNIRRFLGKRGNVNKDILKTCSDTDVSYQFWFLNNGITIICDSFDPVTDQDNPHVNIKNMQIVNGCQTASAIAVLAT
jgi:AIPR protein